MADNNLQNNKFLSKNDALDINELASLNEEITPEFIEQLQNQVSKTADQLNKKASTPVNPDDDTTLFEEVQPGKEQPAEPVTDASDSNKAPKEEGATRSKIDIDNTIDDNFIKKYKAKLNKQEAAAQAEAVAAAHAQEQAPTNSGSADTSGEKVQETFQNSNNSETNLKENKEIENLTSGNILEKPASNEQIKYNESLDYLDANVKYSKYVIYIDPENKDFIDSLTVKERKNLINRILRQQDDIAITKRRLGIVQTVIKHTIIAVITIAIAVPVVYLTINASLEATINNYRRSQSIFQTLYREHGKIKTKSNFR